MWQHTSKTLLLSSMPTMACITAKEHCKTRITRRLLQQGEHLLMLLIQAFLLAILLNLVLVAYLKSPAALDTPTSQAELGISEANVVLELEQAFVDLSLKANGKADLYFHAYFWQQYLTNLNELYASALDTSVPTFTEANYPFMGRLNGLSATLGKVIANIRKFPFSEKMYRKYV
jgi:hypothetical protein